MISKKDDIAIKSLGLNKKDVDEYINSLINDDNKKLTMLSDKVKQLKLEKNSLIIELENQKKENVIYEEEETKEMVSDSLIENAQKRVDKTIALIGMLADEKIEHLRHQAQKELEAYDEKINELEDEIDTNKNQIIDILNNVSSVIKQKLDNAENKKRKETVYGDNIINLLEKKLANKASQKSDEQEEILLKKQDAIYDYNAEEIDKIKTVVKTVKKEEKTSSYHDANEVFVKEFNSMLEKNKTSTVMILEVNEFIVTNFFVQSSTGNEIMKEIINRIKQIDKGLFVVRLSYDRVGILFGEGENQHYISKIAKNIIVQTGKKMFIDGKDVDLTSNIGIVLYHDVKQFGDDIFTYADIALYKAKERGKNNYQFINDYLIEEVKFNNDYKNDLIKAIDNDEIELYYQPQHNLRTNEIMGFEALMRWKNKKYSKIPILNTIKLAEKERLIDEIGELVMRKACQFAKEINNNGKKYVVSVNFSPLQIMRDDFIENVKRIIEDVGVSPDYIGIEITETCFMGSFAKNKIKIEQIKNMGIKVSIDDFGTGYSTLSYLFKLPVTMVKIDKTFLDEMTSDEKNEKFIRSIINIIHDLNLEVIAEGVETKEQYDMLIEMKCDYIQGYYKAKPMPEKDVYRYIS